MEEEWVEESGKGLGLGQALRLVLRAARAGNCSEYNSPQFFRARCFPKKRSREPVGRLAWEGKCERGTHRLRRSPSRRISRRPLLSSFPDTRRADRRRSRSSHHRRILLYSAPWNKTPTISLPYWLQLFSAALVAILQGNTNLNRARLKPCLGLVDFPVRPGDFIGHLPNEQKRGRKFSWLVWLLRLWLETNEDGFVEGRGGGGVGRTFPVFLIRRFFALTKSNSLPYSSLKYKKDRKQAPAVQLTFAHSR